ncbi:MAG: carboxyl transferase domain-containing protein [Eubacteriales bacterium]
MNKKINDFVKIKKKAMEGSGEVGRSKQHAKGKLTARERVDLLFDKGTFVETNLFVETNATSFGMEDKRNAGDGVITGYGMVDGRPVCVMSQDFTFMGGALGEMNAAKIVRVMEMAYKNGMPFITLNDSGGARIQEGVNSLKGYGDIFYLNTRLSGVIPQISAIMGPCAGGAVYSPAITDFIFMVDKTSNMCITGTKVIKAVTGEEVTIEQLGGASLHNSVSGVAHFKSNNEKDCIEDIKKLLSYLPSNNKAECVKQEVPKWQLIKDERLNHIVPENSNKPYNMLEIIDRVMDRGSVYQVHKDYAPNIITAFARLNGSPVGVVANQPIHMAGCLESNSSDKAARFVRFCDCFNIPIITFTDVPGYLPGVAQEHGGIIRHGAKMLYAFAEATVPKINVIIRKSYGGAYVSMNSLHLGADFVFAWPSAEVAVMGAEGAIDLLFFRELKNSDDPQKLREEKLEQYRSELCNPYEAAKRGFVTDIILPEDTRETLVTALGMISNKQDKLPDKKHGNIPL